MTQSFAHSCAQPIELLLADDHPLIRSGMRLQIEPLGGSQRFRIHEAADGQSLREHLQRAALQGPPIDLALVDVMMPGMQGVQTLLELAQAYPQVAFLVVTGLPTAPLIAALQAQTNIRGLLDKSHSAAELRRAIDLALAGVAVWPEAERLRFPRLSDTSKFKALSVDFSWDNRASKASEQKLTPDSQAQTDAIHAPTRTLLSPRQHAVATAVARGLSNAEIAAELGLSEGTVKTYLKDVFRLLGTSNRTQLALRMAVM